MKFKHFVQLVKDHHSDLFPPRAWFVNSNFYTHDYSKEFETLAVFIFRNYLTVSAKDEELINSMDTTGQLWEKFRFLIRFFPDHSMPKGERRHYTKLLKSSFGKKLFNLKNYKSLFPPGYVAPNEKKRPKFFYHQGFKSFRLELGDAYFPAAFLSQDVRELFIKAIDKLFFDHNDSVCSADFSHHCLNRLDQIDFLSRIDNYSWPLLNGRLNGQEKYELYVYVDSNYHDSDDIYYNTPDKSFNSYIFIRDAKEGPDYKAIYLFPKYRGLSIYRFLVSTEKYKLCLLYIYIYFSSNLTNKRHPFRLRSIFSHLGVISFKKMETIVHGISQLGFFPFNIE